jgi:hypothetical protein
MAQPMIRKSSSSKPEITSFLIILVSGPGFAYLTEFQIQSGFITLDLIILESVLRIQDVYPGSRFFLFRIQGQKDYRIRIRIKEFKIRTRVKELKYFNQKSVSKLSEI